MLKGGFLSFRMRCPELGSGAPVSESTAVEAGSEHQVTICNGHSNSIVVFLHFWAERRLAQVKQ